jgi:type IV secretion system protein VirB9
MPLLHLLAVAALYAAVQEVPAGPVEETTEPAQAAAEAIPDQAQAAPQQSPSPAPVRAAQQQGSSDPRIQLLPYDPDRVVNLSVSQGFASVVELAEDERVENLIVGNSGAWQVTANRRGDRVIVKPLSGAAQTNMVVLTATRRYVFVLDPFGETSFVLRFTYPQPTQAAAAVAPETTYKLRGDKTLFPLAMYDDGRRTVIRWSPQHPLPAIFALSGTQERLVNGRMVGDDLVVEGASPRYKFRYGRGEATAIRQTAKRRR